jgi:hypothetical protein
MAYCACLTFGGVVLLVGESTQRAVLFSRCILNIYCATAGPKNIQSPQFFFKPPKNLQSRLVRDLVRISDGVLEA